MTETIEQSTALSVIEIKNPALVFVAGGLDPLLSRIKEEVRKEQPNLDISTPTGRKAIASLAYKIAQTKTKLDSVGKSLTEEQRQAIDAVNAERKRVWEDLEKLQKEVRQPLTDWENAEELRVQGHEDAIRVIKGSLIFVGEPPADDIKLSMENLKSFFDLHQWEEFNVRATYEYNTAMEELVKRHAAKVKAEVDAAELARLQKAEADRQQKERDEKIAAEAKAEAEEKAAAEAKALAEKVEADKAAEAKKLADAIAKADADRRASEQAAIEAAHKAKVDAQKSAEKAAEDERKKAAEAKAAEEAATKKREADLSHKKKINNEALADIKKAVEKTQDLTGADPYQEIIKAIAKGEVRHVSIKY